MANNGNGLGFNSYSARYMADIVAAGGTTPALLVQQAIESLSVDLCHTFVSAPISVWPFYGGNAASHAVDLFHHFDITWNSGTVTHDANGVTGDGTTGWGFTNITPTTVLNPTAWSMGVYIRTASSSDSPDMGALVPGNTNNMLIYARLAAGNYACWCGGTSNVAVAVGTSAGLSYINRYSSSNADCIRAGTIVMQTATIASTVSNAGLLICAAAGSIASARNIAMAWVGPNVANYTDPYAAIQAFQTVLGRQV